MPDVIAQKDNDNAEKKTPVANTQVMGERWCEPAKALVL